MSLLLPLAAAAALAFHAAPPEEPDTCETTVDCGDVAYLGDQRPTIVITAALAPSYPREVPAAVTVIEASRIDALGEPLAVDLLRLAPGVAVASSGPAGSQAQLRIRGAEANHTLLTIDGIRFNDPASGNEARFELLSNDGIYRIDVVRGAQSALYGAEAIGGVVAVETGRRSPGTGVSATAEAGGDGFRRLSGALAHDERGGAFGVYGGYQRSVGLDSFAPGPPGGERDGYDNLSFGGSARAGTVDGASLSAAARFAEGTSDFDGFDPVTFARVDSRDSTRNRIGAGRIAVRYGDPLSAPFHAQLGAALLGSTNRNKLDGDPLNRTSGRRLTLDALVSAKATTGRIDHRLVVAADYERERFAAEDEVYGGATNQRRSRDRGAVVAELRSRLGKRLTADVAVRHDSFEGFADATTLRGSLVARVAPSLTARATYGEGVARPTFFDLFGFFPNSFAGNSYLRPERSRGGEVGLRYDHRTVELEVAAYRQRLGDEIVDVFDSATFLSSTANATGTSRRQGIEVGGGWRPSPALKLSAGYAFLDAEEPEVAGGALVKEVRRPRHSFSLAGDAKFGRLTAGASLAYVGPRADLDFATFPAARVRLAGYALANARLAYAITPGVELFARVSNLFDDEYQDVVGYATQGRTAYGGVRFRYGD